VQSFTARMPLLTATTTFGLRRGMLEFSSTVLSTLSPYLTCVDVPEKFRQHDSQPTERS